MPKMRTNRSAAKRFTLTGSGKLRRKKQGKGHLLTAKSRKRKRSLRQGTLVDPADHKRIKRILGLA
jgi:large subunit ribosomal protein L35